MAEPKKKKTLDDHYTEVQKKAQRAVAKAAGKAPALPVPKPKAASPGGEPKKKTSLIDSFVNTRKKAIETAESVKIMSMQHKRPRILDEPGSETAAASNARKLREADEAARKAAAKKKK